MRTFIALGGDQVGATVNDETYNGDDDHDRQPRRLGKLSGMAGGSAAALPVPSRQRRDRLRGDRRGRRHRLRPGLRQGGARYRPRPPRSPRTSATRRWPTGPAPGTGGAFVDIAAVRGLIEKAIVDGKADAAELKKYETDIKPFLVPFDALFAASSIDGDLTRSVIYITVK